MEAGFMILAVIISLTIGAIIGIIIERNKRKSQYSKGILFVDYGDRENEPTLFLQATVPVDDIVSQNQISFDVKVLK